MSARLKLTLSYAGFLMLAGVLLLAVVWLFLLRYVPEDAVTVPTAVPGKGIRHDFIPGRSDLWEAFAPRAALALGALLVFGLGGGWFLAGRMLAPISRITDATRAAARGSLSHRIRLPGANDEFRELADAFDGMLARLEAHVAEQRRFAANASHELRTPLAVMQTMLDVAREDPDRDPRELVERLHTVNARAIRLTDALLLLGRLDEQAFAQERVDLSLVAEEAAETLLPLAEERGISIRFEGVPIAAIGSHALLQQLATNLVHNAIVHNRPRGSVWVTTGAAPDAVTITIENTGPPVPPELVPTLLEPFQRAAERTRSEHDGVGLGLAIARSITEAHGGRLDLSPRTEGGLRVTVRLPAAPRLPGLPVRELVERPPAALERG